MLLQTVVCSGVNSAINSQGWLTVIHTQFTHGKMIAIIQHKAAVLKKRR